MEQHPGLGSSWTGAGSSMAAEDGSGGRPRQDDAPHGFRAPLFPPLCRLGRRTLEQHNSAAFCSLPSVSPSPSFLPDPSTPEKLSHALGPPPCYPLQKEGSQTGGCPGPQLCQAYTLQTSAQAPAAAAGCHGPLLGQPTGSEGHVAEGRSTMPHTGAQPPRAGGNTCRSPELLRQLGSTCYHRRGEPCPSGKSPQILSRAVGFAEGCEQRGDATWHLRAPLVQDDLL